jgi:hypothetical protein
VKDAAWGDYLLTFEHDHLEVAGLNPVVQVKHVASLLVDTARVAEIEK